VSEHRPPPPITVSDPSRPGQPRDVVTAGDERDPWHPGKRTWSLLAVLVVLAAIAVPLGVDRQHRAKEQGLDAAAAKAVALGPTNDPRSDHTPVEGRVGIGLRNDADRTVTLVSYQVLAEGYTSQQLDLPITSYATAGLDVPDTATCGPSMLRQEPQQVRLTVRTSRGTIVQRTESLVDGAGHALAQHAQQRCGYLGTSDATVGQSNGDAHIIGRTLTASLRFANKGRLPLRISGIQTHAGTSLTVTPRLPITLPYEPHALEEGLAGRLFTFHLTVTDCALAGGPSDLTASNGELLAAPGLVAIRFTGGSGPYTSLFPLDSADHPLLGRACP
jgi:hypothetical protein